MIQLPRPLEPWAKELNIFPRESASQLAPLVTRLERLVGPLRTSQHSGNGEPDGFDGLSRRGLYERLLTSEWLLAEEAPLEFARRAAVGEHTFLQLARREPRGEIVSLALFDAGPNQLGAPRLAHLAALIVLYRRALAAGAHFRWGILNARTGDGSLLQRELTESNIRELLAARSSHEVSSVDMETWSGVLDKIPATQPLDFWVIGGARLQPLLQVLESATPSLVCVREALQTETRQLVVSVQTSNLESHPVTLELPEEAECARLLRDPFGVAVASVKRTASKTLPTSNLLWASETKLLARSAEGALLSFAVPNSPRGQSGKPRQYRPSSHPGKIVAAGRWRRTTIAVTLIDSDTVAVQSWGKHSDLVVSGAYRLPFSIPETSQDELLRCSLYFDPMGYTASYTLITQLPGRRLVKIAPTSAKDNKAQIFRATYESQNALDLQEMAGYVYYVGATQGLQVLGYSEKKCLEPFMEPAEEAFIGFQGEQMPFVLSKLPDTDKARWAIRFKTELAEYCSWSFPAKTQTAGVSWGHWRIPAIVTWQQGSKHLELTSGRGWKTELPSLGAPIQYASVSPFSTAVAMQTIEGEIGVYSLKESGWTLRISPNDRYLPAQSS